MPIDFQLNVPFLCIFILMVTAIVLPLLKSNNMMRATTFVTMSVVAIFSLVLILYLKDNEAGYFTYQLGKAGAPWTNELRAGMFEAVMALVFSVVMMLSIAGGYKSYKDDIKEDKQYAYYVLMNMLTASLLALVYTNDLFTAYVFIEINTVAACGIVVAKETGETVWATIKYFIMSALGSGLLLFGISILYTITGHLLMDGLNSSIQQLVSTGTYMFPLIVAFAFIMISVCVKSALFPFHSWLPDAHGSATATSSAILSGLVLKGYIILLIKVIYRIYGIETIATLNVLPVILILGLAAMMYGSIMAVMQKEIKQMIAYSSVAQVGYIFMGIGLGTKLGLDAAVFHIVTHAITKAMLFLNAGTIIKQAHVKKLKNLGNFGYTMPITMALFTLGALSMIGIPPSIGFSSKWNFAEAIMTSDKVWIILLLAISSLLNALYYLPVVIRAYFNGKDAAVQSVSIERKEGALAELLPMILLGISIVCFGLYSDVIFNFISVGLTHL